MTGQKRSLVAFKGSVPTWWFRVYGFKVLGLRVWGSL